MSRDYLQHGRRHHPETGSDPIPGVTDRNAIMVAYGTIDPGTGNTPAHVDLTVWATSSEDVFTLEPGTGGLSAIHAVAIHEAGIYRVWSNWTVDSGTVGDTLEGELDIRDANVGFWAFGNTQNTPSSEVVYDNSPAVNLIQTANLLYVGGLAGPFPVILPAYVFVTARSQGGHDYHIEFELLIERLAITYTSNTVSHFPV